MKDIRFQEWIKTWWMLLVPVTFATVAVLVYAIVFRELSVTRSPDAWGTFGDFLGGLLNPLVSTLTLFVAVSVWKLQREELELTRNELAQTKLAMEDQAKTTEQQRQEQRFFDLLNVYQRTVDSISQTQDKSGVSDSVVLLTSNGKQAISVWLKRQKLDVTEFGGHKTPFTKDNVTKRWNNRDTQNDDPQGMFDHYFRVIHHLLCEAEALLGDQHIRYIELFRAQLSPSELIVLGFNLWLNYDAKQMIPLFEKYCLLKYLPAGYLRIELEELYPLIFGNSQATEKSQSLQLN